MLFEGHPGQKFPRLESSGHVEVQVEVAEKQPVVLVQYTNVAVVMGDLGRRMTLYTSYNQRPQDLYSRKGRNTPSAISRSSGICDCSTYISTPSFSSSMSS